MHVAVCMYVYLALQRVVIDRIVAPLRPIMAPTYSLGTIILYNSTNISIQCIQLTKLVCLTDVGTIILYNNGRVRPL